MYYYYNINYGYYNGFTGFHWYYGRGTGGF